MYAAAKEFMRDIPSSEGSIEIGDFERWRKDQLRANTAFDCSFVALEERSRRRLHRGRGQRRGRRAHTGSRASFPPCGGAVSRSRSSRRRSTPRALAGMHELRTANAMENPMRLVNERLGFRRDVDWIHLRGPLLDR